MYKPNKNSSGFSCELNSHNTMRSITWVTYLHNQRGFGNNYLANLVVDELFRGQIWSHHNKNTANCEIWTIRTTKTYFLKLKKRILLPLRLSRATWNRFLDEDSRRHRDLNCYRGSQYRNNGCAQHEARISDMLCFTASERARTKRLWYCLTDLLFKAPCLFLHTGDNGVVLTNKSAKDYP